MSYTVEEIVWLDSSQLEGGSWMRRELAVEMMDDLKQRTVGYVIAASDVGLLVARSLSAYDATDTHEMIEGALVIPVASVVSRVPLSEVGKRPPAGRR